VECDFNTFCFVKNASCNDIEDLVGPFKLQFNSYEYFSVMPNSYLVDGVNLGHPGMCIFGIFGH